MDPRRLRFSDHVPPSLIASVRPLSGLPRSWARPIDESRIDGLLKRADGTARALSAVGELRPAAALRRTAALLERVDELHRHSSRVETLAQLYRALATLHAEVLADPIDDESISWLQAGALATSELSAAHGPAFRQTAALRNRAFRALEAAVARHARDLPSLGYR